MTDLPTPRGKPASAPVTGSAFRWRVVGKTTYNHDPHSLSLDPRPTPATLTGKWHDNQHDLCDEMEKCLKHAPSWTWEIETQNNLLIGKLSA